MPPLRTWLDIVHLLKRLGASPTRQAGSHQVWTLPDGAIFVVRTPRLREEAPPWVCAQLRRRIRAHRAHTP